MQPWKCEGILPFDEAKYRKERKPQDVVKKVQTAAMVVQLPLFLHMSLSLVGNDKERNKATG